MASTRPVDTPPAGSAPLSSRAPAVRAVAAAAARGSTSSQKRQQEEDIEPAEPHWDLGVYQRVFLTEAAAQMWFGWNSMRGDPAQPFHYQHLLQHLQQEVRLGCTWHHLSSMEWGHCQLGNQLFEPIPRAQGMLRSLLNWFVAKLRVPLACCLGCTVWCM